MLDVVLLVHQTPFPKNLQKEIIPDLRFQQSTFGYRTVQFGEMTAIQVPDQVGGAEF